MSLAIIYSRAQRGIHAPLVTVETHLSRGLPSFSIVGLPETVVKESKDRVRSALINARFEFPLGRITVNLAPADLPKEGGRFDLPIALGILIASSQLRATSLRQYEFAGELALSGQLRSIRGALPFAIATRAAGRKLILPNDNLQEAGYVKDLVLLPAQHIVAVCQHLSEHTQLTSHVSDGCQETIQYPVDLSDVHGQQHAKRALEIAAAGRHSLLLVGPPGTGKTMLASRLISIMPPMTDQEAMESAAIASVSFQGFQSGSWGMRPYRAPHHSASSVALVGGGNPPKPGEISLAHHGVLFLDEATEFKRPVLEALREPLESGSITISRAARQSEFPARFQLIIAMNPCPCGYLGDSDKACCCSPAQIGRYRAKLSGPFLDRLDMQIIVPRVPVHVLASSSHIVIETSAAVRERVCAAAQRQYKRAGQWNAQLTQASLLKNCRLPEPTRQLLEQATQRLCLSARSYYRTLKLALTIADLESCDEITAKHLAEALSFRNNIQRT